MKRGALEALLFAAIALTSLASCIEWSTNSQGQLQSFGLPGLPVWQTQTLSEQKRLAANGELAAAPGSTVDPDAAQLAASSSDAPWLEDMNRWRTRAGVDPVGENFGLSNAGAAHACYLVKNGPPEPAAFFAYENALGGAAHTEDPGNQFFTRAGSEAARRGDISWERDPNSDINSLVEAPFHRLSILAPWVRVAGYGDCGRWPRRAATLVLRGSTPAGLSKTIVFPPDGSSVAGVMRGREWPNPLAACPGYSFPVGTPLTVQFGAFVRVSLKSYSIEDATTGREVEACGFDSSTYPGTWGRRVLLSYGALVVIPRAPLAPGHTYSASIGTQRHELKWTFEVEANEPRTRRTHRDSYPRS